MGKHKSPKNLGLPPFLTFQDGVYVYRNRGADLYARLGEDRAKAIKVANKVNARLMEAEATQELLDVVDGTDYAFSWSVREFMWHCRDRGLAAGTLYNYEFKAELYKRMWGGRDIRDIEIKEVSDHLKCLKRTAYPKHRTFLIDLWNVAIANGVTKVNPAAATLKKSEGERERDRLELELYHAILEIAPVWLRNAMELSLLTLQSRLEVRNMRFDEIIDGKMYVIRQKTEKKTDLSHLAIEVTPQFERLIRQCRDDTASPYLVHYKPGRKVKNKRWPRKHWTQLTPDMLTREFARIRDKELGSKSTASFHEIRSLGSFLYKKQGVPPAHIQALLGHSSIKMSKHYMAGHEIDWSVCTPILEMK